MSQSEETYNGWSNYETWLVSMHFQNHRPTYKQVEEITEKVAYEYDRRHELDDLSERSAEHKLEERLEHFVENKLDFSDLDVPMLNDLVSAAIGRANFREIAESRLNELQEVEV